MVRTSRLFRPRRPSNALPGRRSSLQLRTTSSAKPRILPKWWALSVLSASSGPQCTASLRAPSECVGPGTSPSDSVRTLHSTAAAPSAAREQPGASVTTAPVTRQNSSAATIILIRTFGMSFRLSTYLVAGQCSRDAHNHISFTVHYAIV
ncbi:unnamed protein product, partial [Iphiclides podalirius]